MKAALYLAGIAFAVTAALSAVADDKAVADKPAAQAAGKDVQNFVLLADQRPVLVRLHVTVDGKPFQTVWEEFVEYLFKSLDGDGDGVLSAEEAAHVPPASMLFGSGFNGNPGYPTPAALGADQDGKVTLDKLKAYYRREGAAPFQFHVQLGPPPPPPGLASLFQPPTPPQAEAITDALFAILDTNKDGKLTREKLLAAEKVLLKLDLEDNEMITIRDIITVSEKQAAGPTAARPPGGPFGGPPGGPRPRQPTGPLPVVLIGPDGTADKLAKEMLAKYGKDGKEGKATDVSREELGLDAATFKLLDADGDGKLDANELARFAQRDPDAEFTIRLGGLGRPVGTPVEVVTNKDRPSPLADRLHTLKGGAVFDLGTTWFDVAAGGRADSLLVAPQQLRNFYRTQFGAADKGGKGHLDSKDCENNPLFRGVFKAMDADGDGKVTEKEMSAYLDRITEWQNRAKSSCVVLTYGDQSNGFFDLLDTNHDGRLSIREMRQAVKLLDVLGHASDAQLRRSDIPRIFKLTLAQGGVGGAPLPPRLTQNVIVGRGGFGQPPPPRPTAGPLWFRKMDRNGDGDVSRREFPGTDEEFAAIDTDGDGLISAEEAERYDAKMRKK
jgi:Ca2+-binding EF-hand superfamily protein